MMEFAGFGSQPRGLHNFISDIRNSKNKEDERMRVDKELAHIRNKFSTPANLTSYDKKKYVWKLCYIYMLGYEIDFGHVEFISLLSSTKFQEKSVGYMAFSMMFRPGDELMTLAVNSMRNDIVGRLHHGQTLALAAVSNMGGGDLAEALSGEVQRLVAPPAELSTGYHSGPSAESEYQNRALLCKKAALCLLRLFRTNPDCVVLEDWTGRIAKLLEDRDLGVITSVMSLLLGFASAQPVVFEPLVPYVISILTRLVVNRTCTPDYLYYFTPSPWLQVKCLRFLQYYRLPTDQRQKDLLNEALTKILVKTESSESNNKSNADHSILFEAVNLIILYGSDTLHHLKEHCASMLGKFVAAKDPNTRYLGIDAMTRMTKLDGPEAAGLHQAEVLESLKDIDVSLRKKALNLLYVMSHEGNAKTIVEELLANLAIADSATKEDIVVKIAILTEKYHGGDMRWYVDTMVQVLLLAGDYAAEAVWFRVAQVVTNCEDVHEYAADKLLQTVKSKFAHETIVSLAAYVLGEMGVDICEREGSTGYDQFAALHQHFANASPKVQALLLSTYAKFVNLYPEQTKDVVLDIFRKHATSSHLELQQRSVEYASLSNMDSSMLETVLNVMPPFKLNDRENVLMRMDMGESKSADASAFDTQDRQKVVPAVVVNKVEALTSAVNLLDVFEDSTPSPSQGLSPETLAKLKNWFISASFTKGFSNTKTLLENDQLLITVAHEYRAHQGRMLLTIFNKGSFDISDLQAEVSPVEGLNVKLNGPTQTIVIPGADSKVQIASECSRPFNGSPSLTLRYRVGGNKFEFSLPLPTTVCSFSSPVACDQATFMTRWGAITAENTQQQQIFSSARPVSPELMKSLLNVLMPGMGIGHVEGIDNEKTFTGCTAFTAAPLNADAKPVSVGVLLRLEGDPANNRFRITVRATNPTVSVAVKDLLVNMLSP